MNCNWRYIFSGLFVLLILFFTGLGYWNFLLPESRQGSGDFQYSELIPENPLLQLEFRGLDRIPEKLINKKLTGLGEAKDFKGNASQLETLQNFLSKGRNMLAAETDLGTGVVVINSFASGSPRGFAALSWKSDEVSSNATDAVLRAVAKRLNNYWNVDTELTSTTAGSQVLKLEFPETNLISEVTVTERHGWLLVGLGKTGVPELTGGLEESSAGRRSLLGNAAPPELVVRCGGDFLSALLPFRSSSGAQKLFTSWVFTGRWSVRDSFSKFKLTLEIKSGLDTTLHRLKFTEPAAQISPPDFVGSETLFFQKTRFSSHEEWVDWFNTRVTDTLARKVSRFSRIKSNLQPDFIRAFVPTVKLRELVSTFGSSHSFSLVSNDAFWSKPEGSMKVLKGNAYAASEWPFLPVVSQKLKNREEFKTALKNITEISAVSGLIDYDKAESTLRLGDSTWALSTLHLRFLGDNLLVSLSPEVLEVAADNMKRDNYLANREDYQKLRKKLPRELNSLGYFNSQLAGRKISAITEIDSGAGLFSKSKKGKMIRWGLNQQGKILASLPGVISGSNYRLGESKKITEVYSSGEEIMITPVLVSLAGALASGVF